MIGQTIAVANPSKPARTLTVGYYGGQFSATLSGLLTDPLSLRDFSVTGYEEPEYRGQTPCQNMIESDNW